MKDVPPSQKRVLAIVEMMEECGLYTHAREVARLDEQRNRCEDALRQVVRLLNSTAVPPGMVMLASALSTMANTALTAGIDEEFEYIQQIARELRAAGTTTKADIEARLRKDGKLDKDTPTEGASVDSVQDPGF